MCYMQRTILELNMYMATPTGLFAPPLYPVTAHVLTPSQHDRAYFLHIFHDKTNSHALCGAFLVDNKKTKLIRALMMSWRRYLVQ